MNKYSFIFLLEGFVFSIVFFRFEILKKKTSWLALLTFIILIIPNFIWQLENDFPIFQHFSELYKTQLDKQSLLKEFALLILFLNPLSFFIWATAIVILPFNKNFKSFSLSLFSLIFSFLLLLIAKGKSYYYFPIILGLIPFGSVFYEQILKKKKLLLTFYIAVLVIIGVVLLPNGLPLLSLNQYIQTYHKKQNRDNKIPLDFENYYSNENWNRILNSVNQIYTNLPSEEKKRCLVWGRHSSMAGGINLLGCKYNLPPAFSFHSSFYTWVPEFTNDILVIAISESNWERTQWERYFSSVTEMYVIENHFASESNWYNYRIFLCKKAKYNSTELKQLFRDEIY